MKPMLSAKLEDPSSISYPVLASPKLDGIRCLIQDGRPVTRTLKDVPNRQIWHRLFDLNLPPLDGELIVGSPTAPDCYRRTNSGVMSREGSPDWRFHVFDVVEEGSFERRLAHAKQIVQQLGTGRVCLVVHKLIKSPNELLHYEERMLKAGYEGIMGRSRHGLYKNGRATMKEQSLWKLKRFADGEARIVGFDEQMHNANEAKTNALGQTERSSHKENKHGKGTLGALKVEDVLTGVAFDIGTGFSDSERQAIWDNRREWEGRIVKYKSLPIGVKDKPRHPVYLGERLD